MSRRLDISHYFNEEDYEKNDNSMAYTSIFQPTSSTKEPKNIFENLSSIDSNLTSEVQSFLDPQSISNTKQVNKHFNQIFEYSDTWLNKSAKTFEHTIFHWLKKYCPHVDMEIITGAVNNWKQNFKRKQFQICELLISELHFTDNNPLEGGLSHDHSYRNNRFYIADRPDSMLASLFLYTRGNSEIRRHMTYPFFCEIAAFNYNVFPSAIQLFIDYNMVIHITDYKTYGELDNLYNQATRVFKHKDSSKYLELRKSIYQRERTLELEDHHFFIDEVLEFAFFLWSRKVYERICIHGIKFFLTQFNTDSHFYSQPEHQINLPIYIDDRVNGMDASFLVALSYLSSESDKSTIKKLTLHILTTQEFTYPSSNPPMIKTYRYHPPDIDVLKKYWQKMTFHTIASQDKVIASQDKVMRQLLRELQATNAYDMDEIDDIYMRLTGGDRAGVIGEASDRT